jgi:hypothetical protein
VEEGSRNSQLKNEIIQMMKRFKDPQHPNA